MSNKIVEPLKMFKTKFDDHKRVYVNHGTAEIPVRKARNVDGVIRVDETKEVFPLQEWINSFKDSCDIEVLLKRFQAGDMSVMDKFMERTPSDYVDLSNIPDNFNDMMNLVRDSQTQFNELPAEIKEKFDNNFEKWASSVNSDEWMVKMGYEKDPAETSGTVETTETENTSTNL